MCSPFVKNVASQSSFSARKEIPQTLRANSLITVPYRRDFSIFLLRSTNQQPSALTFASLSAKNLKSHLANIPATKVAKPRCCGMRGNNARRGVCSSANTSVR